jgi:hypothetical protein
MEQDSYTAQLLTVDSWLVSLLGSRPQMAWFITSQLLSETLLGYFHNPIGLLLGFITAEKTQTLTNQFNDIEVSLSC